MIFFDNFKDTIFLKEDSSLQKKYIALKELLKKYPNNEDLQEEIYIVKKGLDGEKEIHYQLEKCNLGLFVLHDINLEYENLKAQIDYVVFSKAYVYFVECKNLIGNITVNEKGDFIREYSVNGKKIKKGIYSPLRQVEAQREVFRKIWESKASIFKKLFQSNNFNDTYKVLVVASNNETILNTKYAPNNIKYKIIKADALIRQIEYDLNHYDKELYESKKSLETWANHFLENNIEEDINYIQYYEEKFKLSVNNNVVDDGFDNIMNLARKYNNKKIMIVKNSWGKGNWCIVNKVIFNTYNEYGNAIGYINYADGNKINGNIPGAGTYSWRVVKVLEDDLEIEYKEKN